ncbi:MAG TPA: DUF1631 family protein [Usitatibacter sp.]|nr:DUF1631 family protein [Usitatibacter sp.]
MPQNTAFDTLLAQSRDLFGDKLGEALAHMFDSTDAHLSELATKTTDKDLSKRYLETRDAALANRETIEAQFKQRLMSEFDKRANKVKKVGTSLSDFSLDELSLVGEDDLNETLKFNDMAAKLRRYCEDELSALDQRVGVLLGDATIESEDNPFGPQVILDAYKNAVQKAEQPIEIRMVFLKLFDDHVADTVRSSYKEVNDLLVENGILPKIRYGISKSESKDRPAAEKSLTELMAEKAKAAGQEGAPSPQDMFAQLAQMMAPAGGAGGPPAAGMGIGNIPLVQGAQLMSSLTQLQVGNLAAMGAAAAELGPILAEAGNLTNVLKQLKGTSVGGSMSQVDAMTLDIVAMLFDEIFDDPKIPIALKGLIGHLQLPMLKVAIADKDLFTAKTHPARQLLDTLGQVGLRLPGDFGAEHPLFAKLEAFIKELVDGFQEKMEIFDTVRAELQKLIDESDATVAKSMEATEKEMEKGERLALAKVAAEEEIRKRVGGQMQIPRPIVRFLALQWIKYLVITYARDGKDSETWKGAVTTMDELLSSIVPKATLEERRGLARVIPGLLKRLKTGVTGAGIEDAVSSAFFVELMKVHTEIMQTKVVAPVAATPTPTTAAEIAAAAKASVKVEAEKAEAVKAEAAKAIAEGRPVPKPAPPTPAKPPAPVADELDFTAPVEINNPFGEGKVEVSSDDLDFSATTQELGPDVIAAAKQASAEANKAGASKPGAPAKPAAKPNVQKAIKRETVRLPSAMIMGAWVEILDVDTEARQPARLHYVSPLKSHFLFVDRKGKKVFECSRSMLARRMKLGEVTMLEGEPDESLFDRVVSGIFGKLRQTAPA